MSTTPPLPATASASTTRRPTTPLRRLSASSLRSLSLSHSRSHPNESSDALAHLAAVFAELADGVADLAANFEALDKVNNVLDGFNEAFGGYLYALRMNAYTADFDEAPTAADFQSFLARQAQAGPSTPPPAPRSPSRSPSPGNETAFVSGADNSEFSINIGRGQTPTTRGRGGGTRGRGRGGAKVSKRERAEQLAFADTIIQLLPIPFREQPTQRGPTEKIIILLRDHPAGMAMADLTAATSVATHRANESLTALVRAKVVLKVTSKGVAMYRLDPNKYPTS